MLLTLKEIIGRIVTKGPTNAELMSLAKAEYKKDWEWAYQSLLTGKNPMIGEKA